MENEILLRQVLRIYRNAIVSFVRAKLRDKFGTTAGQELGNLFAKIDPTSKLSQWESMRRNAERARLAPEVSTAVEDDFDVLGIGEFFPVFEKYYDVLFPEFSSEDPKLKAERKNGILRCLRQIKVVRDPNAHEVTEDTDLYSLALSIANAIKVLVACKLESEAQRLWTLLQTSVMSKPIYSALILSCTEGETIADNLVRNFKSRGVVATRLTVTQPEMMPDQKILISKNRNIIAIGTGTEDPILLREAILHCSMSGRRIVPVLGKELPGGEVKDIFGQASALSVLYYEHYAQEATERIISKLIPSDSTLTSSPPVATVSVAEALVDGKFSDRLLNSLRTSGWKYIWLVSPFASDVPEWRVTRQALSVILAQLKQEGVTIKFITRPPVEPENGEEKKLFLDRLERDEIEVLLNSNLHAKIYLFESPVRQFRWYLGSHNLTVAGLTRWRDVSLAGFREAEYLVAKTAMSWIENHRDTIPYYIWKARLARNPWGKQ